MNTHFSLKAFAPSLVLVLAVSAFAQKAPAPKESTKPAPAASAEKAYSDVITSAAVTHKGMFKVHEVGDKVYWEIPPSLLGKQILWQSEIEELPQHIGGFLGFPQSQIIQFNRHGGKIYLNLVDLSDRSEGDASYQAGFEKSAYRPIVEVFKIEATSPEKAVVIDVTQALLNDKSVVPVSDLLGRGVTPESSSSYIEGISAYPDNIKTRIRLTVKLPTEQTETCLCDTNLIVLPEKPMMPRFGDLHRIGFFSQDYKLYRSDSAKIQPQTVIDRFRLEKKDPSAPVSDPVKQIVFYISSDVPAQFRPYMKQAVDAWNEAFLQAGFSHAIIAKDQPTKAEDPNWSEDDIRYNVIRWVTSPIQNAMGVHFSDPRTGETLCAHVMIYQNVVDIANKWYFSQCADLDPRAKRMPFPSDLQGELLKYVVTHEVGHCLGLEHNQLATTAYTAAQLRDPSFTRENGVAASIMAYSRFNYVAQPGDNAALISKIGPYDKYAIEYGYKPIPDAKTPEQEKPALEAILDRQYTNPWLKYAGDGAIYGLDARVDTEIIGSDPVEAASLGLKNLQRIAKMVVPATEKDGETYQQAGELLSQCLTQLFDSRRHLLKQIGGRYNNDYTYHSAGNEAISYVPMARQKKSLAFLLDSFQEFDDLVTPELRQRGFIPNDATNEQLLVQIYEAGIHNLYSEEQQRVKDRYHLSDFLADVQTGIWSDLHNPHPRIGVDRRALQTSDLQYLDYLLNYAAMNSGYDEAAEIARAQLKGLSTEIGKAALVATDEPTKRHLQSSLNYVAQILEGKTPFAVHGWSPSQYSIISGALAPQGSALGQSGAADPNKQLQDFVQEDVPPMLVK